MCIYLQTFSLFIYFHSKISMKEGSSALSIISSGSVDKGNGARKVRAIDLGFVPFLDGDPGLQPVVSANFSVGSYTYAARP